MSAELPLAMWEQIVHVDPAQLTPRAAAIARIWSAHPLHTWAPLTIESTRTLGELVADPDVSAAWGPAALAEPHRTTYGSGTAPGRHISDPAARLEYIARQLPIGYMPISRATSDEDRGAMLDDTDLLTRQQVADLLREQGRPITLRVIANYKSRPPAGWPQPVRYVARTPLWSRAAIEAYANAAD